MRNFKFRAWNEYAKTMYEVNLLHISNKGWQTPELIGDWQYMSLVYQPKTILMQFTGLFDKNGKEIYEGDIVRVDGQEGDVYYDEYAFAVRNFYMTRYDTPGDAFSESDDIEIIGNIYEKATP